MSQPRNFSDTMAVWAAREPSVQALVLFGSQARTIDDSVGGADTHSDWDFQIITSCPRMFSDAVWLRAVKEMNLKAYAARTPRIGAMPKINAAFAELEADFVIIPARVFRFARIAVKLGLHHRINRVRRSLQDLSVIVRPGYRFLKGGEIWEPFYRKVLAEIPDPRLSDKEVRNLAEGFVCDFLWAFRKIKRGELIAVQRLLHRELTETNFRLLHELRMRRGEQSFHDARRLERIIPSDELERISVNALLQVGSLQAALVQSANTMRYLVKALLNETWNWPDISY